jgi:LuxR family transcriptional regulator, maltose regulon positive regulatory protein
MLARGARQCALRPPHHEAALRGRRFLDSEFQLESRVAQEAEPDRALLPRQRGEPLLAGIEAVVNVFQIEERYQRHGAQSPAVVHADIEQVEVGDTPRALAVLEQALTLAEPEGFLRVFVDEGQPLRRLLRHAAARGVAKENMRRLLTAFDAPLRPSPAPAPSAAGLARTLTRREIEILRLMAGGMQNQEIATQLFVSTSTVKRHVANAYGKLDVGNRTAAVARANELHLL